LNNEKEVIFISSYLQWKKPLNQTSWNFVKIEKASSITGTYSEIASVAIATSYYFDIYGLSTDYYKIRFFDSVNNVYSNYSDAMLGETDPQLTGQTNNDILKRTLTGVNILGTLGATGPDSTGNFTLFGMTIHQNVAESIVRQCYNYTTELVGEPKMISALATDIRQLSGFITSYSALRILGVLSGVAITTHFNYSSGGLNIQKPVVGQMRAMLDLYAWECRRWQKLLLTRSHVGTQTDLDLSVINETSADSGITYVSYDFPNI
jgi:hypothetical protein